MQFIVAALPSCHYRWGAICSY